MNKNRMLIKRYKDRDALIERYNKLVHEVENNDQLLPAEFAEYTGEIKAYRTILHDVYGVILK